MNSCIIWCHPSALWWNKDDDYSEEEEEEESESEDEDYDQQTKKRKSSGKKTKQKDVGKKQSVSNIMINLYFSMNSYYLIYDFDKTSLMRMMRMRSWLRNSSTDTMCQTRSLMITFILFLDSYF